MLVRAWFAIAVVCSAVTVARAGYPPVVPGAGQQLVDCGDDFEDPNWTYSYKLPKSSYEQDELQRAPGGVSSNGLWHEGAKRGTPDMVRRVDTPPDGIPGSTGALLMATRLSGVPGRITNMQMQDDLLMKFDRRIGRSIPVGWQPSCTVRVFMPPFEKWENRTGASFGMRVDCVGRTPEGEDEPYWPGIFVLFRSETSKNIEADHAELSLRADQRGRDIKSLKIESPGWWTLGMSFTPDGRMHYYAHAGVADLTSADYLMSSQPYSYTCKEVNNFFFNVANWDNGQSWSTPWIIDDPKVYVIPPAGLQAESLYVRRQQRKVQVAQQSQGQTTTQPNRRATNRR